MSSPVVASGLALSPGSVPARTGLYSSGAPSLQNARTPGHKERFRRPAPQRHCNRSMTIAGDLSPTIWPFQFKIVSLLRVSLASDSAAHFGCALPKWSKSGPRTAAPWSRRPLSNLKVNPIDQGRIVSRRLRTVDAFRHRPSSKQVIGFGLARCDSPPKSDRRGPAVKKVVVRPRGFVPAGLDGAFGSKVRPTGLSGMSPLIAQMQT